MLWIVAFVLTFFWVLGVATSYTMSGYIHVLYVLAMIAGLVRVISRRGVL